jgi:hypothetical protein
VIKGAVTAQNIGHQSAAFGIPGAGPGRLLKEALAGHPERSEGSAFCLFFNEKHLMSSR